MRRQVRCGFHYDILVYYKEQVDHEEYLSKILQILREKEFYVKFSKREFSLKKVSLLDHFVSKEGTSSGR